MTRNIRRKKNALYFFLFTMPGLMGFVLLSIYPMIRSFMLSFTNRSLLAYEEMVFVGLKNYIRAFNDTYVIESLKNSVVFTIFSVVIANVMGMLSALLLNSITGKCSGIFRTLVYLPSILPAVSLVVMFSWIFDPATGIINTTLARLGVKNLPLWFMGEKTALLTLILTGFWAFGGKMVIYLSARQGISIEYYEAAALDGATGFKAFYHITLPSMTSVISYNVLMSIIGGLQVFTEAYVLSGTGKGALINFYVLNLYSHAFNSPFQLGYASSLAWILFIITTILAVIYFAISNKFVKNGD